MTEDQVRDSLRKACDRAGSIRAWARNHSLSAAYVSDVLLRRRAPGPSICEPLGIAANEPERIVTYRKIRP